jgi:leucyl aminopeptidase
MKFSCKSKIEQTDCDSIIYPFFEAEKKKKLSLPSWSRTYLNSDEFSGECSQMVMIRDVKIPSLNKIKKALFVGMGKLDDLSPCNQVFAYSCAFNALRGSKCKKIAILMHDSLIAKRLASQIQMAVYSFDKYKQVEDKKSDVDEVVFITDTDISKDLKQGQIYGEAANFSRAIQNEPANVANPLYISKLVASISKASGLKLNVLYEKDLKKEKMEAMLAVAQGSQNKPCLVVMEYHGNPSSKSFEYAFVGKGVTFDSGGISLKPSPSMDEMKFDKSGACAVIGAMSVLKKLSIKKNVVGVAALVENMPGSKAYRPGDIIRASNGKTIEVLNTDAEGRVVLADALSYTIRTYNPDKILDFATLTGACVVALGDLAAGLMCTDEPMLRKVIDAGTKIGENVWPLPSWAEYDEKVKSEVATVKNIGERGSAGTITAYSFLKPFAEGSKQWAHIDIAGTAWISKPKFGLSIGGTGFGTRLILEYLQDEE